VTGGKRDPEKRKRKGGNSKSLSSSARSLEIVKRERERERERERDASCLVAARANSSSYRKDLSINVGEKLREQTVPRDKRRPHKSALQLNRKEAREIVGNVIAFAATSILASTCQCQRQSRPHRSRGWKTFSPRWRKLKLSRCKGRSSSLPRRSTEKKNERYSEQLCFESRGVYRRSKKRDIKFGRSAHRSFIN